MEKVGKVFGFLFVCLIIFVVLVVVKESGGGAVMWIGALAIPFIYRSMFGKKEENADDQNKDITLNK